MQIERSIDPEQIWNLGDLYQGLDDPCLNTDQERLEARIGEFETQLAPQLQQTLEDAGRFAAALEAYAEIQARLHDLSLYAELEWNVATLDSQIGSFRDGLNRRISEWSNRLEFFRQALTHLDAARLEALLGAAGVVRYQAFLERTRRFQPYLRSEAEERLLQLTRQFSRQRWLDFYTQTTSGWHFEVDGQTLTEDQAMDALRKTDPDRRLEGYRSVYGTYHRQRDFIGFIYNTLIQEYAQEARLRGFESTLAQQAFEQELSAEQVQHLLAEVRQRLPLYQRYYRVLGRNLGREPLRSCDLTAPLRAQDWEVDWRQGRDILLAALSPLGDEMVTRIESFFSQRWIHAQPLRGKSSGAFCAPTSRQHPFVLMNWNDNLYSLTALAHELGHALHFDETVRHQHVLHLMPPLFLAETASTLNEYLLAHHLMQRSDNADDQRYFLSDLLQRFLNGLFRQSLISEFEVFAHTEGARRSLSADELAAEWLALARERGGDAIDVLETESAGWSRVPHLFIHPFYCYNYTLSNVIVLALVHQYHQDAEAFLNRYRAFLRSGGGSSPTELLQLLQLDLADPELYRHAFDVLEKLIAQLEALDSSKTPERGQL